MNEADVDDRRGDPRAPIELRVEYKRLNMFFADYTRNISKGGTFIGTERPLTIGTEFVFSLVIPTFDNPLKLVGRVKWIIAPAEATEEQPAGMGIEFQYQTDQERLEIDKLVRDAMIEALGAELAHKLLENPS